MDYTEIVKNTSVYGIEESILASGYPMSTDTSSCSEVTEKDMKRADKLASTPIGSGHSTFLVGCVVQFNLTLSVKAWTEAQRYHFFDFVSSQSTMHCITKFDLDKAYIKYVDPSMVDIMKEKISTYNQKEDHTPEEYLEILYSNPCGFRLTARMTTNYQQLRTIYHQRKTHRLPEWRAFCKWIETLPHSEWITGKIEGEM